MGIRPLREGIPISQEYGTNPGGYNPVGGHTGRDYAAFQGEKLVAIADGRVWFADHSYNPVSYTHLTLPTIAAECRSRWSPYQ